MKDLKKTTQQYVSLDGQNSGCSMGCMGIGCVAVFMVMLMMCGGGFYGLFYSSLPLKAIEAALEQSGEIEIEGLTGNLTTGFSIDDFRFKTESDSETWSNLTDIKFKYANNRSWLGSDRLIIEELSVDGGTIYAHWDPEQNELDLDPKIEDKLTEIDEDFEDIREDIESEFNGEFGGIREVRIDLVRIADLKIVDPTSGLEITLDEIKFDGFQWLDGKLVSFGELLVRSNQMELDTVPSIHFVDQEFAQRFEGKINSQMDRRLKSDVSFALDFTLVQGKFWFEGDVFGEAIHVIKTENQCSLEYVDFSPVDYLRVQGPEILPSSLNFKVDYGTQFNRGPVEIAEQGSFQLGATRFENLRVTKNSELKRSTISGIATVNGAEVTAELYLDDHSPFWITILSGETFESKQELWAQTVYGQPFSELDEARQASVTSMLVERQPAHTPDVSESEGEAETTSESPDAVIEKVIEDVLENVESATDAKSGTAEPSKPQASDNENDG